MKEKLPYLSENNHETLSNDSATSLSSISTSEANTDLPDNQKVSLIATNSSSKVVKSFNGNRLQIFLVSLLVSIPIIILTAILSIGLSQPLLAIIFASILTSILTIAVANKFSDSVVKESPKNTEIELLEVENNRLSQQLHALAQQKDRASQQRQLLSNIAFRVQQVPDLEMLFTSVVEGAQSILQADRVVIYRFNPDWTGTIVAEAVVEGFAKALAETIGDPCFLERYIAKYQGGLISNIPDVYQDPKVTDCYLRMLEKYQVKANLVVPIRQDRQLYGLLIAHQCSAPRYWTDTEINLLSQIATEMEFHLDFIHKIKAQEASSRYAWFLGDIAFRARQTQDFDDIIQATLKGVRQLLATDRVLYYQFNPDWSGTMIAESVAERWPSVINEKIDDPCFRGRYVELYRNGRVRAINNIRNEPGLTECHIRTLERYGVKANIVAPIRQNNQLMGLLIAHHCSESRVWTSSEIDFLSQVAIQLEYAIEHLNFIQKLETVSERNRLFGDIAFRARQSMDRTNVIRATVQGALKILATDRILLYQFNPDWSGTMIAEAVSSNEIPRILDAKIEDPCFKGKYVALYQEGRVRAINNIMTEPGLTDCHVRTLEQYDVKANLVAPIRLEGKLFGLLIAHHCQEPRVWQSSEIEFFSELATQLEYALGHIRFIETIEASRNAAENASQEQRQQTELVKQKLAQIRQEIEGAMSGNLTVRATASEGDIGVFAQFLNAAIENLQNIVLQVQQSTSEVTQTAEIHQKNVATLAQNSHSQALAIATSLEATQAISASIQTVADNAQQAKQKVKIADQILSEGNEAMTQTVEAISTIQAKVEETAQQVKLLGESSQNISRVVQLIRDLASQTNVLALNASIESGIATEQSQGFTIVAEEVRAIAERSKGATQQIEKIVEEIQTEINQVVATMEEWREDVAAGNTQVENTRQKLTSIAVVSKDIRKLVEAIAEAATNQSHTSLSVSNTMQEVEVMAQQNSTHSVTVSESFNYLVSVAQKLENSVSQFKAN